MLVFFHGCSIIQFGCDCHPHCIKCIAAANQYKEFNSCHSCKKVDSRGHSLSRPQKRCLRVGRLLLRNTLGFRRIRQIHTFKLAPIQMHEMIKDRQLFLRHRQQ